MNFITIIKMSEKVVSNLFIKKLYIQKTTIAKTHFDAKIKKCLRMPLFAFSDPFYYVR